MKEMLQGIAVSGGIAIGEAFLVKDSIGNSRQDIEGNQLEEEFYRLDRALEKAQKQLEAIKDGLVEKEPDLSGIIEAQLLFLQDPHYVGDIREIIKKELISAEKAVDLVTDSIKKHFGELGDKYFLERLADLEDLSRRLKGYLSGNIIPGGPIKPSVVIARQIFPSQVAGWDRKNLLGLATEEGGSSSHVAIMAKGLCLPAVLGVKGLMTSVATGEQIIIDGHRGEVHIKPGETLIDEYKKYQSQEIRCIENLVVGSCQPAETKDGIKVILKANVFTPEEATKALAYGASGIGLLRTELIFETLNQWPSEEEQFYIYQNIIKKVPDLPVTIRTLDIGGDKQLPYTLLPLEENPFLGLRGIRLSLEREEIFKTQLRAILRAGVFGQVNILLPMVTDVREVRRVREIIDQVKADLKKAAMDFADDMELGIMVEVPAAALTIDIMAEEADFFSIGTNDLIQYTMAVDRNNDDVSWLYDPLQPAVLRLIDQIINDAQTAGNKVSICGEMAGDKDAILILLGLGVREFSMNPEAIPVIRELLKNVEMSALQQEVATLIEQNSASEIRQGLGRFRQEN